MQGTQKLNPVSAFYAVYLLSVGNSDNQDDPVVVTDIADQTVVPYTEAPERCEAAL